MTSGARTDPRFAAFLVASDLDARSLTWQLAEGQLRNVASSCSSILGFEPELQLAPMGEPLEESICGAAMAGVEEIFVLPVALDLNLFQREALGRVLSDARRSHPTLVLHHDDVDPGHSLLVDAFADQVSKALASTDPPHCGLILAPSGHGDASSRGQSYRLMRLIWERLGLAAAEVGVVRHERTWRVAERGTVLSCGGGRQRACNYWNCYEKLHKRSATQSVFRRKAWWAAKFRALCGRAPYE